MVGGYTFACLEGLLKDAKCLAFDLSGFVADCEISGEVRAYVLARALDLAAAAVGRPLPGDEGEGSAARVVDALRASAGALDRWREGRYISVEDAVVLRVFCFPVALEIIDIER